MSYHKIRINETYQCVCATCFAHSTLKDSATKDVPDESGNTTENCIRTYSVSTYETSYETNSLHIIPVGYSRV
jgi:hypothetical protein